MRMSSNHFCLTLCSVLKRLCCCQRKGCFNFNCFCDYQNSGCFRILSKITDIDQYLNRTHFEFINLKALTINKQY